MQITNAISNTTQEIYKHYLQACRGLQDSKFILHSNIFHHQIYLADSANCIVGGTFSKSQVCEVLHQKVSVVKPDRLLIKKCQYVTCISRFSKFDCRLQYRYLQYAVKVKLLKLLKAHYCFFSGSLLSAHYCADVLFGTVIHSWLKYFTSSIYRSSGFTITD